MAYAEFAFVLYSYYYNTNHEIQIKQAHWNFVSQIVFFFIMKHNYIVMNCGFCRIIHKIGHKRMRAMEWRYWWWWCKWWEWICWLLPGIGTGIGMSSLLVRKLLTGTGTADDVIPFVLFVANTVEGRTVDTDASVAVEPTSAWRFLISVTERKLADNPSLDASDMDKGDVWSKDPTISACSKNCWKL